MQELNWQPISFLPKFESIINEMFENGLEVFANTLNLKSNDPYLLDDYITTTVFKTVVTEQTGLWMCDKQLEKWEEIKTNTDEQKKIKLLKQQMVKVKNITDEILNLAEFLTESEENVQDEIINNIMLQDDIVNDLYFASKLFQ